MQHRYRQSPPPAPAPKKQVFVGFDPGSPEGDSAAMVVMRDGKVESVSFNDRKLEDIHITCIEDQCREPFVWDVGQQEFAYSLLDQGIITRVEPPKRCPPCRLRRKQFFNNRNKS